MASVPPTQSDVTFALKRLGEYRCMRAQEVMETSQNLLKGSHALALGLRETWGQNIEGGAKQVNGNWVKEDDPKRMDVGWLQISRRYHPTALAKMPGVKVGTWAPVVSGKTANDGGYVPRFTDGLRFTVEELMSSIQYGSTNGVPEDKLIQYAIAAHNAGRGGALSGVKEGNVDKYTAGGDYSSWVLQARTLVVNFLNRSGWVWTP